MADLGKHNLYGYDLFRDKAEGLGLQYHLTVECDQHCRHCYMFGESTYESQKNNSLDLQESIGLVDQYYAILEKYGLPGAIAITGGDPILSPLFEPLLKYLKRYHNRIRVSILGNSYHINSDVAKKLADLEVYSYQISIDGLQMTHDSIRKKGSFDDAIRALKILHKAGIQTHVMFTLSKENAHELKDLIEWVNNNDYIDAFGFDRVIPIGNAKKNSISLMEAKEYAEILFECYKDEVLEKRRLRVSRKDNLWKLLMYQLGLVNPFDPHEEKMVSGCEAGIATLTVLADGKVCTCRRIGEIVGDIRKDKLEDIYRFNDQTQMLRKLDQFEDCAECELRAFCRGCAAMKNAVGGSVYARDPHCWRTYEFT